MTLRQVAAYLLDRADQYDTDSGCWVCLADAAHEIMNGEAEARVKHGELDDPDLLKRVDGFKERPGRRPVDPRLGVDE
jgi:hypothetical protein